MRLGTLMEDICEPKTLEPEISTVPAFCTNRVCKNHECFLKSQFFSYHGMNVAIINEIANSHLGLSQIFMQDRVRV